MTHFDLAKLIMLYYFFRQTIHVERKEYCTGRWTCTQTNSVLHQVKEHAAWKYRTDG
jgi:hypothetical protein